MFLHLALKLIYNKNATIPTDCFTLSTSKLFIDGELQEAKEALARADSSSSDSEDDTESKKKKDQDKPTEEVTILLLH